MEGLYVRRFDQMNSMPAGNIANQRLGHKVVMVKQIMWVFVVHRVQVNSTDGATLRCHARMAFPLCTYSTARTAAKVLPRCCQSVTIWRD